MTLFTNWNSKCWYPKRYANWLINNTVKYQIKNTASQILNSKKQLKRKSKVSSSHDNLNSEETKAKQAVDENWKDPDRFTKILSKNLKHFNKLNSENNILNSMKDLNVRSLSVADIKLKASKDEIIYLQKQSKIDSSVQSMFFYFLWFIILLYKAWLT